MAGKDLTSIIKSVMSLAPEATTASREGVGVDTLIWEGVLIAVHAGLWTDGTHTIDVLDSNDDVTYVTVAADFLQGTKPVIDGLTDDNQDYHVGYVGSKRYVRVDQVVTASPATGVILGASVILGHPKGPI